MRFISLFSGIGGFEQGFPNGWTTNQKDSTRYRQLGNAVAVPVVEWIGKRIVRQNEVNNGNEEN